MSERPLARLVAPYERLARMIRVAALKPGPGEAAYYDEMLVRVTPDGVETPAGSTSSSLATYCSATDALFDELDLPSCDEATAIFDIQEALDWLAWVGESAAEPVEVELFGDPARGIASRLNLRADGLEACVDCYRDQTVLEEITFELPRRFTDDERFVLEDGSLASTEVRTSVASLERIVSGVERSTHVHHYPFVVEDGTLRVSVADGRGVRASGTLPGSVTGPDVANHYGEGFDSLVETLVGDVWIQTADDEPLVVVQDGDDYTVRYVVLPVVW